MAPHHLLLFVSLWGLSQSYPTGAPTSACDDMVPQHGTLQRDSASPYVVRASSTSYRAGQQITVTIENSSFKGFFLQARKAGTSTRVGRFQNAPSDAQYVTCRFTADAITHVDRNDKSSVTVTWVASANGEGDIEFVATIVEQQTSFWVQVKSAIVFDQEDATASSLGSRFYLMFLDITGSQDNPELYLSTSSLTTVVTTTPRWNDFQRSTRVSSNFPINLERSIRMEGSGRSTKGILVESTEEIYVRGLNKEALSADGFLALPVEALGTDYYAVTYTPQGDDVAQVGVVGVSDGTVVCFELPAGSSMQFEYNGLEYVAKMTLCENINELDTIQIQSSFDLTGLHIYSSHAVAAFSGNKAALVGGTSDTPDHLVTQLIPVKAWGVNYVVAPLPDRDSENLLRIVASEPDTVVTFQSGSSERSEIISGRGLFWNYEENPGNAAWIVGSKPIMVTMFGRSQSDSGIGDATMSQVPPVGQFNNDYRFSTPDGSGDVFTCYVIVAMGQTETTNVELDGEKVDDIPTQWALLDDPTGVIKSQMAVKVIPVSAGGHVLSNPSGEGFGAVLYGYTRTESFSFPLGLKLGVINDRTCIPSPSVISDKIDNDCDGRFDEELCDNLDDDSDGYLDEDCYSPGGVTPAPVTTQPTVPTTRFTGPTPVASIPTPVSTSTGPTGSSSTTATVPTSTIVSSTATGSTVVTRSSTMTSTAASTSPFTTIEPDQYCTQSHKGRRFLVMFLENRDEEPVLEIYITSPSMVSLTVEAPNAAFMYNEFLSPGEVMRVPVPNNLVFTGTGKGNTTLLIEASGNIVVHGYTQSEFSSGGFLVFPIPALGMDYHATSWWPPSLNTQIGVAAVNDDTQVSLTLPSNHSCSVEYDGQMYSDTDTIDLTLQAYETLQLQDLRKCDLSGTRITSSQPIAVFSGTMYTSVPWDNMDPADNLVEQVPPVFTYGTLFYTTPTPGRFRVTDRYTFISSEEDTTVTITGQEDLALTGANMNAVRSIGYGAIIRSDKPILVTQFIPGDSATADDGGSEPSMAVIPPVTQYLNTYEFVVTETLGDDSKHLISVVIEGQYKDGLKLNGYKLGIAFTPIQDDLDVAHGNTELRPGAYSLSHDDPTITFGVYIYGISGDEDRGYAFPVGMCLDDKSKPPVTLSTMTTQGYTSSRASTTDPTVPTNAQPTQATNTRPTEPTIITPGASTTHKPVVTNSESTEHPNPMENTPLIVGCVVGIFGTVVLIIALVLIHRNRRSLRRHKNQPVYKHDDTYCNGEHNNIQQVPSGNQHSSNNSGDTSTIYEEITVYEEINEQPIVTSYQQLDRTLNSEIALNEMQPTTYQPDPVNHDINTQQNETVYETPVPPYSAHYTSLE